MSMRTALTPQRVLIRPDPFHEIALEHTAVAERIPFHS